MLTLLPQPVATPKQTKPPLVLVPARVAPPPLKTATASVPAAGPAALVYTLLRHGRALPRQEAESRLRESMNDILDRPREGAAEKASGKRATKSSGDALGQRSVTLSRVLPAELPAELAAEPFGGPFQAA